MARHCDVAMELLPLLWQFICYRGPFIVSKHSIYRIIARSIPENVSVNDARGSFSAHELMQKSGFYVLFDSLAGHIFKAF